MLRSLFSGITGLRQHQTMMDVVGNNIANVNTTGYKTSSVVFEDTLSQLIRASGAAGEERGGVNPAQVGLGVQLGGINVNFGQGSAQSTGKATDLMVQGDGFFIVRDGQESLYTRAGAFCFDSDGRLVNNQGLRVQGWVGAAGVINTDGAIADIVLPAGTLIPPSPSSSVTVGGNIISGTESTMTLGVTVFDQAGNSHDLSIVLTYDSGSYQVEVLEGEDSRGTGTLEFLDDGTQDPDAPAEVAVTLEDGTEITIGMGGVTSFGGSGSLAVTDADGYSAGSLQQFQISADGTVVGIFSNGEKLNMAQIALSSFNNPQGLEKAGNSTYRSTSNSGLSQVGVPGSGARGTLLAGSLEMSNVDLAQEFTGLIIAQRGFQANSRVITASDEILQDLVNIKR
ncbi:MAG: flagellar hook protein FlgE [Actinomycetales bacterium]|nr:flagellar hook protein FlgE [Actinomycetales bacterium]